MSYCPKCGSKIEEEMSFCPKCGAPLKVQQTSAETRTAYRKEEKSEKSEKGEKGEKTEKREKHEGGFLGPLIGGLVLIFIGVAVFVERTYNVNIWAFFFVLIGVLIIVGAIYGYTMAAKRHPKTQTSQP
jgi:uncharacterized membrane protein YvbJ